MALESSTTTESDAVLARLLAAWRRTHDPALEQPILRIGAAIARARGALRARSKAELELAWLALAEQRDAGDLDRLLDAPWPAAWKTAKVRVEALAKLASDPRLGHRLSQIAASYTSLGSRAFHVAVARLLARSPTPAALEGIATLETTRGRSTAEIYREARDAIEALAPTPADAALLEEAHRTAPSRDLEALYAEVARDPGSLELRGVLADALLEIGDPRGEFITLQCAIAAGTADAKARARASALLAPHIDAWTGPLPELERGSREFERGFLVAVNTYADADGLLASIDRREWVTVERLAAANAGPAAAELFRRMPLLRELAVRDAQTIEALARLGPHPSITTIGILSDWIEDLSAFPNLRVLGGFWFDSPFEIVRYRDHQERAARAGLRAIVHIAFPLAQLHAAVRDRALGPSETRIGLDSFSPTFDPDGWRVRTFRDSARAEVAWTGGHGYMLEHATRIVDLLETAGIEEIALHVAGRSRARVEDAVAGHLAARANRLVVRFDGLPIDLAAPAA